MSNVLTSYGANNIVIEQDYNFRFQTIEVGDPAVTVELSGGQPTVQINSWYHATQEETARWRYVGMDYDTAQACATQMRTLLTHSKYAWNFGTYLSGGNLRYGYYKDRIAPCLESDVALVKNGNGAMYDVVVDAHVTDDEFTKSPLASTTGSRALIDLLDSLDGWRNYPSGWANGKAMNAATISNLVIVTAPSRKREFELAGQDIFPKGSGALSNITFPMWYKCTDTYTCQLKYTGMTLSACRNLYNQLNVPGGWWLSCHPYQYVYSPQFRSFNWEENENITQYQCLNEYKATKDEGNMWTAELNLHVDSVQYTKNPNYAQGWAWPDFWATKIPGLNNYL